MPITNKLKTYIRHYVLPGIGFVLDINCGYSLEHKSLRLLHRRTLITGGTEEFIIIALKDPSRPQEVCLSYFCVVRSRSRNLTFKF